jgi:hypothetical protein
MVFQAARLEDGGTKHTLHFRMTSGEKVVAEMSEEEARFFFVQSQQVLAVVNKDEWTRLPTTPRSQLISNASRSATRPDLP